MRKIVILSKLLSLSLVICALLSTYFLVSCHYLKDQSDDDIKLTYESKYVKVKNDLITIDISDLIDKKDTLDAEEIIGANYVLSDTARIKIIADAEIVKAEKKTYYYPTVWASPGDEVMQFIYLFNLGFVDVMPLNLNEGIIEYPISGLSSEKDYMDYFGKITKSEILSSIDRVPAEYASKDTLMAYECNTWESESKTWKRIADGYRQGELIDDVNEPFDVDKFETMLVLTFKNDKGEFEKVFRDEAVIGN